MLDKDLEKAKYHKEELYIEIKRLKQKMDFLNCKLSKIRRGYAEAVRVYSELDRKIFEATKGITAIGKNSKKKSTSKTLEELSPEERETLLKQLIKIQARRRDGKS